MFQRNSAVSFKYIVQLCAFVGPFSFFIFSSSCSSTSENFSVTSFASKERRQNFENAEELFHAQKYTEALPHYIRLTQGSSKSFDPLYDESLWRLVQIYEKNDEPEKALVALEELSQKSFAVPQEKLLLSQIKNSVKVGNPTQAREFLMKFDRSYRQNNLSLPELYEYLEESVDFNFDRKAVEETVYLGEMQKYFVFIMESPLSTEGNKAADLLIKTNERFFNLLNSDVFSNDFKKLLAAAILDQLQLFDRYRLENPSTDTNAIKKFSAYSQQQKQYLTESFPK